MSKSREDYLKYKKVCKNIDDKIKLKFREIHNLTLEEMLEYEKDLIKLYDYSKRCFKLREICAHI